MADNYQVLEELDGSFGVVYKAIEKSTGELVAIKHIDLEGSGDDLAEIQQEISVLSTCKSPYVTQYKASFVKGVKLWIVMEYLGGGSCLDLLKPGSFSEAHIAIICRELLLGLDYLHHTGKIHRDIKAANTLLSQDGRVKIADFGVAAQLTNIKSQRMTFVGTPFWMAPEVIQENGYDFKADIWSLGITAMEMANGAPPNAETHPMKVLFLIPKAPAPRLEGSKWSKDFKDFIASCLIKDPDRRATAKELLRHRFIQRAGRTETLRELILRKEQFDTSEDEHETHRRYYEETMQNISPREDQDEWVFDTLKPSTVKMPVNKHTTKRRKLARIPSGGNDISEALLERLNINETPLGTLSASPAVRKVRKVSTASRRSSFATAIRQPSGSTPTARRVSDNRRASGQKQPLGLDMSFGNSPSTVRQFRRVSGEKEHGQPGPLSRSNSVIHVGDGNTPIHEDAGVQDENAPLMPVDAHPPPATKEALLGRRAFSKIIDPALQETYAQTGSQTKREALSKVANAWSALDRVDPEGEYLLLKMMLERVSGDARLATALGIQFTHQSPVKNTPAPAVREVSSIPPSTPSRRDSGAPDTPTKTKLVLAQNNPHLKSHHRRRQSAFVGGAVDRDLAAAAHYAGFDEKKLPGHVQPGMEHAGLLADVLYGRWMEGLKSRWPLS
ncbi:Pkinase-domain-containing protein [Pseudovirgaria hyperparasitica]|uniref:non-specific serine/threonine protein kinase n=1 Tax=Pseudovirgaria hyperparasitica TaxID=470096 RepID=A0A6A6VTE7_9PEZI|nr:Pkinase-domain-containing protein [Pseudovirgaria hyperparasitica]KAF2753958.1 Pkinase-domain-containing protein [Pseudovirgaria hyperparasitica]